LLVWFGPLESGRGCKLARHLKAGQCGYLLQRSEVGQAPRHTCQQARAVGQNPLDNLSRTLTHNQLLSIYQCEHGVR